MNNMKPNEIQVRQSFSFFFFFLGSSMTIDKVIKKLSINEFFQISLFFFNIFFFTFTSTKHVLRYKINLVYKYTNKI